MSYTPPNRYSDVEITVRGIIEWTELGEIRLDNGVRIKGLDTAQGAAAITSVRVVVPGPEVGTLGIFTSNRGVRSLVMFRTARDRGTEPGWFSATDDLIDPSRITVLSTATVIGALDPAVDAGRRPYPRSLCSTFDSPGGADCAGTDHSADVPTISHQDRPSGPGDTSGRIPD